MERLTMNALSDEELVVICLRGNNAAFEILVERYQKQLFSMAYRLGGDYDEARDMAQEAFIHIYKELNRFDSSRKFFPWMYRVAHNSCVNFIAKKARETAPLDVAIERYPEDQSIEANPELSYEHQEFSANIHVALLALPEQYRLPLMLKYVEGYSYKEISDHLGLPVSTIETRLFRGRKALQKLLKK